MAKETSYRHARLRLHGTHPLERLATGEPLLSARASARAEGLLRARGRTWASSRTSRPSGAMSRSKRIGGSWSSGDDIDLVDVCTPNFMHKDCVIAGRRGGQDRSLREADCHECGRGPGDGRRCREGGRGQHGLLQLSARACDHAVQAVGGRRPGGTPLPLSGQPTTRTTRLARTCPKAGWPCGDSIARLPVVA